MSEPSICQVGGGGTLFPAGGDSEQEWPQGLRIGLYMFGLLWSFLGVGIAADCFMGAIEVITSKRTRRYNSKTGSHYTITVWNATVANLSLMALGSSAPEILLNVIEILTSDFMAGDLGPSTIVGSAAFNLLCITAVCVYAIDSPDVRYIKETGVYTITASFSIFAYLWLLIILLGPSPNVVGLEESLVTFLFFPLLLALAFLADKGYIFGGNLMGNSRIITSDMSKEELSKLIAEIRQIHGADISEDQVMRIIEVQYSPPTSRAQYRVAATRRVFGGKQVQLFKTVTSSFSKVFAVNDSPSESSGKYVTVAEGMSTVEFASSKYATLENAGSVVIVANRKGDETVRCKVKYATEDGSAKKDTDYVATSGELIFEPGEIEKEIYIKLVDDIAYEEDEDFFVKLFEIDGGNAIVGGNQVTTVTIIDDDISGTLKFPADELIVNEGDNDVTIQVVVERHNGSTGKISCDYQTEDASAIKERDYEEAKGKLELEHGQMTARIPITIRACGRYESKEMFRLVLSNPTGGAKFCQTTDGGEEHNILTIIIMPSELAKNRVDALFKSMQTNWDKSKIGHANWKDQIIEALYIDGGEDDDGADGGGPGIVDYVMHGVTLPWKVLFALVPPTDYCGGWICFFVSLVGIGLVTMLINDLASLLGCVMCIPDAITAITFVALGTSLPDTFASMSAAKQDPHADASIGNVTGSNSVNVFLGLGLPWTIAAIYWLANGSNEEWLAKYEGLPEFRPEWASDGGAVFIVIAGDLSFSVLCFSCCASVCIAILALRRQVFGGELGGPLIPKIATSIFLVCLWLLYVVLTITKTLPWACAEGVR